MGGVEIAVMVILTGILVVVPVVVLLLHHQRKMAELHGQRDVSDHELAQRLDMIQRDLAEMKNRQNELILQKHDELPPPIPTVESGTPE